MSETIAGFAPEYVALVEAQYKDIKNGPMTPTELKIYLERCAKAKLDALSGQIVPSIRVDRDSGKRALVFMTTIDALRLIADRTGCYTPGKDTEFGRELEKWDGVPEWARVFVKKLAGGVWHEYSGQAFFEEYVQLKFGKEQTPTTIWLKMPHLMIAKCAEALALRKGFPNDLMGLYVSEEMDQAENQVPVDKFGEPPRKAATEEGVSTPAAPNPPKPKATDFPFGHNATIPLDCVVVPRDAQTTPETRNESPEPSEAKISPTDRNKLFAVLRSEGRVGKYLKQGKAKKEADKLAEADFKAFLKTLKTPNNSEGITSSNDIPKRLLPMILEWCKGGDVFNALGEAVKS